jgi:hypothetical protein
MGSWMWPRTSKAEAIDGSRAAPPSLASGPTSSSARSSKAEDFGPEFTPEPRAQEERPGQQIRGEDVVSLR